MTLVIGIDPGVTTGIAVWDCNERKYLLLTSCGILKAFERVELFTLGKDYGQVFVIFEDARKRRGYYGRADDKFAKYGAGIREGVGSVKRDCSIWEEWLKANAIPFEARKPRNTKMDAEGFKRLTGHQAQTNEHSRDAGLIVHELSDTAIRLKLVTFEDGRNARATGSKDRRGSKGPTVGRRNRSARRGTPPAGRPEDTVEPTRG
jgi:hypothetical protein